MRVILLDRDFTGWNGHSASYDIPLVSEFKKRGIETVVFASSALSLTEETAASFRPHFSPWPSWLTNLPFVPRRYFRPGIQLVFSNFFHWRELRKISREVRSGDLVLIAMQTGYTSFACALWLAELARKGIHPSAALVVHNRTLRFLFWEVLAFRKLAPKVRMFLAAHNEPLRRDCAQCAKAPFFELPLPFARSITPLGPSQNLNTVHHVFLGVAKKAKGFDLLVGAIPYIVDLLEEDRLSLTVQCCSPPNDTEIVELLGRLEGYAKRHLGIRLIYNPLSPKEYDIEMSKAGVLILPHRISAYRTARSGVFTEGLGSGIPTITARGTLMSEEAASLGVGVTFEDGSIGSLADAMRVATERYQDLRVASIRRQNKWCEIHSAKNYVDILLSQLRSSSNDNLY